MGRANIYSNITTLYHYTDISTAKLDDQSKTVLQDMTLEDILKGRLNEKSYLFFCKKIVRCMVGKVKVRGKSMHTKLSNYCTAMDEAFALICVINSWNVWKDMYFNNSADKDTITTAYTTG